MAKIVVVAQLTRREVLADGKPVSGWGGTLEGVTSALSCITGPDDTVSLVSRIGEVDLDEYRERVFTLYGAQFDLSGMVADPLGSQMTRSERFGDMERRVYIERELEAIHHHDIAPVMHGANAIILAAGDVNAYDSVLISQIKHLWPTVFVYVDVHRKVDSMAKDGYVRHVGWPGWRSYLRWADVVQMNRHEAGYLLRNVEVRDVESSKTAMGRLMMGGISAAIITLAHDGYVIGTWPDGIEHVPAVPRDPAYAVAMAGDSFGACFVVSALKDNSLHLSARRANTLASILSGNPNFPTTPGYTTYSKVCRVEEEHRSANS